MNLLVERLVPSILCGARNTEEQQGCDYYKEDVETKECFWRLGGKCLSQSANNEYMASKKRDAGLYGDP